MISPHWAVGLYLHKGHFTKNTDLFPGKISNSLNGCPMETLVIDGQFDFTTSYFNHTNSNGSVVRYVEGLEMDLLMVVLKQMNKSFLNVPLRECLELATYSLWNYLVKVTFSKECYIVVGNVGNFVF
jgi:hypothetical protein